MENVEKFQGTKIFEILNLLSISDIQMILDSKNNQIFLLSMKDKHLMWKQQSESKICTSELRLIIS